MIRKLLAVAAVASVAGCASIANPINNNTEATAESTYITAAGLETAYLALSFCASGVHFAPLAPCKETTVIRQVKASDNVAYTALVQVRTFHKQNPGNTVGIVPLINEAISAAQALEALIPLKSTGG